MKEFKKILWPTDFSDNASQALPYVNSITQKYQAQIYLLYVAENLMHYDHFWGPPAPSISQWQQKVIQAAEKRLEDICRDKLEGCPYYHKRIAVGDPAGEILKAIEELEVDLVVMATHGHGWATHEHGYPVFGGVSEEVVKNSPVPVLTVSPFKQKK